LNSNEYHDEYQQVPCVNDGSVLPWEGHLLLLLDPRVVTQFWIHQDFLECYFISIIIYKNPKN